MAQSLQPAYKPALMEWPNQGPRALEYVISLPGSGRFEDDLWEEMSRQEIAFIQTIFIDNSQNPGTFQITFQGTNRGQTIVVQPFHQGYYPVSAPIGSLRFVAVGNGNTLVPVIFYNCACPYFDWGPAPGVLSVPALISAPVQFAPMVVGANVLVPGVALQFAQIYRLQVTVDNPCIIRFRDGPAGAYISGSIPLFAGGSITWQASGVPWATASVGNSIVIESDTAVNMGGMVGFTQQ